MRAIVVLLLALGSFAFGQTPQSIEDAASPPPGLKAASPPANEEPSSSAATGAALKPSGKADELHSGNLLFMRRVWSQGPSLQYACFEVRHDGAYRLERDTASSGDSPTKALVHSGRLSLEDMQRLRQTVDDPALKALRLPPIAPQQKKLASGIVSLDVLTVNLHRDEGVQRLFFDDTDREERVSSKFPVSYGTPAMKPLLDWYQRISERQSDLDSAPTPTCAQRIKE